MNYSASSQTLPWSHNETEQNLFRILLVLVCAVFTVFFVVIAQVELLEPDRAELEALPPQLARFVKNQEAKPKPKTEAPKPKVIEKPTPIKKPEPKLQPKPKAQKPIKTVKKKKPLTETKKSTAEQVDKARAVASNSGMLAMQQEMSALTSVVSAKAFSSTSEHAVASASSDKARADYIDSKNLRARSDAAATDRLSLQAKDHALAAADTTQLIQTEDEAALAQAELNANSARKEEDIQLVVEELRSTLYLLYNRALRKKPFLEGELVLQITIEQSGLVSKVEVLEDGLGDKSLVAKLIARMKLTNFGPTQAPILVRVLPFNFQPS